MAAGDGVGSSSGPPDTKHPYLQSLNAAQLRAVTASPSVPVQILAGPGSGKTRVLTSRVAHLVKEHGYFPHQIVAVTFTNKAANEMRKRLHLLLGPKAADGLVLGTFHATCAKYLRKYAQIIDLPNNFVIADADDCKKIMSRLLKARKETLDDSRISLKESGVLSEISKAKAKEESPDGMAIRAARDPSSSTSTLATIAELYSEYEAALRESNCLDFDDLLVFGLRLFRTAPRVVESCRHILVDEFQDTNTTQYELMRCFAKAHGGVSVVGDPDQSIYGWRSAEVENLSKMEKDFPGTQAIYLEENYRSTGSILAAAHAVVTQDRERIQKNLYTSHPKSTPVTLKVFSTPVIEASFIATEIKRLIAYSGGVLKYDDFAILLRYNALSRVIESALQKDSIPNKIVGGHKFFERMEIKDLLAYLQLADNPGFTPAFVRVVNVPKRAIGDKSVADLLGAAKSMKISPMELSERIIDGEPLPAGIKPSIKKNLATFVGAIRKLRRAAEKGSSVGDLIKLVIERTNYEEYLRTTQPDFDSRWENVNELITYSVIVAEEQARQGNDYNGEDEEGFLPASSAAVEAISNRVSLQAEEKAKMETEPRLHPLFRRRESSLSDDSRSRSRSISVGINGNGSNRGISKLNNEVIEMLSSDDEGENKPHVNGIKEKDADGLEQGEENVAEMTPLAYFLQTSMLSTDTESQEENASKPKVTITTVHAAKGLEWPVVFIPAVEQGTYPSYRCTESHEIAEERRLLYVAMTRAQNFLTLSHCQFRMMGGEENDKEASEFVAMVQRHQPTMFSAELADVDLAVRRHMSKMLARPYPDEDATKDMILKHVRAAPPISTWDPPEPRDKFHNRFARREVTKATRAAEYWASEADEYALPDSGVNGFTSASSISRTNGNGSGSGRGGKFKPDPNGRTSSPYNTAPVQPIKSANKNIATLPFTFNTESEANRSDADLGAFTTGNSASLAFMATLGLPPDLPMGGGGRGSVKSGGSSPMPSLGGSSPNLGAGGGARLPALGGAGINRPLGGGGVGAGTGAPAIRGKKRLGMGRPAPWGSSAAAAGAGGTAEGSAAKRPRAG